MAMDASLFREAYFTVEAPLSPVSNDPPILICITAIEIPQKAGASHLNASPRSVPTPPPRTQNLHVQLHSLRGTIIRHLLRIRQLLAPHQHSSSVPLTSPLPISPAHGPYRLEPRFQTLQLTFLDHEGLIVQVFDDVVVFVGVDFQDYGFY